ncbi:hypothetical protein MUG91_G100n115 [Manis pentadactyla]|nr:hypothetical protein MUG91_G100n115 [Manis pentadactyla]
MCSGGGKKSLRFTMKQIYENGCLWELNEMTLWTMCSEKWVPHNCLISFIDFLYMTPASDLVLLVMPKESEMGRSQAGMGS